MSFGMWVLVCFVLVIMIALLTPPGRKAIGSLLNSFGSALGAAADQVDRTELQMMELQAKTEAETRQGLEDAQAAHARAQEILLQHEQTLKELALWEQNRDEAAGKVLALQADGMPDAQQQSEIDELRAIGQTAMAKIAVLEAAIKANAENITFAEETIADTEELFRSLPARASDRDWETAPTP